MGVKVKEKFYQPQHKKQKHLYDVPAFPLSKK